MRIEPAGRYAWQGICLTDNGSPVPFVVFADTFDQARKDVPDIGELIHLSRDEDVSDEGFEMPADVEARIKDAMKRSIN